MPSSTSASKIALIESQGGRCHFVAESSQVYAEAERLADETGGHYLDQFTNAERATDWRGNNNIAESIYVQMARRRTRFRSGSGLSRSSTTIAANRASTGHHRRQRVARIRRRHDRLRQPVPHIGFAPIAPPTAS